MFHYTWNPPKNDNICNRIEGNGIFVLNYARTLASITDGTSGTILVGETSRFKNEPASIFNWWNSGGWWGDGLSAASSRPTSIAYAVPKINVPASLGAVEPIIEASGPFTWRQQPAALTYGQFGFRSLHPDGANFLFADGSVKFLKEGINMAVYQAVSTFNGGEVVSADSF